MTKQPRPTILWKSCSDEFILIPADSPEPKLISEPDALAHWVDGTADFGENAARILEVLATKSAREVYDNPPPTEETD